jgi:hypothetical protein
VSGLSVSTLLQEIVVGVLVTGCALFSAWRLATVGLRLRALEALSALPALHAAGWLVRLRERTQGQQLRACGGCAAPPAQAARPTQGAVSRNQTPGALRR